MAAYPQSVAYTRVFYAYLTSDHVSAATGKTITVNISKAGAAFGAAAGTVTEIANGAYKIVLTTADTGTIGDLAYYCTATGTDDIKFTDQVTDPIRGLGAPTAFPNAAAGAVGGLPLSVDTSGRVDVLKINGTSQTARDIGASVLLSSGTGTGQVKLSAGYVAPNWGDVGNPTTAVNLSATTVKTLTDAPSDSAGTTTLLSRLSAGRALLLDNLDAAISTRSTYAGGDTSGTTTLLTRLSAARAGYLDNLSAGAVALEGGRVKDLWQLHGLDLANDLVVTPTARTVGTIVQSLSTVAGTTTVHRSA